MPIKPKIRSSRIREMVAKRAENWLHTQADGIDYFDDQWMQRFYRRSDYGAPGLIEEFGEAEVLAHG